MIDTATAPDPQPYPGWPGPCAHFGCETTHPCPLFHDPTACERAPLEGCGCDLEALLPGNPEVDQDVEDDLGPEPEWCPHPECYDRVHVDGMHTSEDGRPFRGSPDPADLPGDDDTVQVYLEVDDPAHTQAAPPPEPWRFAPHPIYDQMLAEQTYPEVTTP